MIIGTAIVFFCLGAMVALIACAVGHLQIVDSMREKINRQAHDLAEIQIKYDASVSAKREIVSRPPEPVKMVRQARSFSEFRDAEENGTKPRGMRSVKNVNPNL